MLRLKWNGEKHCLKPEATHSVGTPPPSTGARVSNENTLGRRRKARRNRVPLPPYMKNSSQSLACVPVYDTCTQSPNPDSATVFEGATGGVQSGIHLAPLVADLRSPADVYHPEAYLIGCLVKLYGWRVLEPGVLRRRWNGGDVAAHQGAA